jgi:hypothetical protein
VSTRRQEFARLPFGTEPGGRCFVRDFGSAWLSDSRTALSWRVMTRRSGFRGPARRVICCCAVGLIIVVASGAVSAAGTSRAGVGIAGAGISGARLVGQLAAGQASAVLISDGERYGRRSLTPPTGRSRSSICLGMTASRRWRKPGCCLSHATFILHRTRAGRRLVCSTCACLRQRPRSRFRRRPAPGM